MVEVLQQYSKFPLPTNLPTDIAETVSRYGRVQLERLDDEPLRLVCADKPLLEELARQPKVREYLGDQLDATSFADRPGLPRRAQAGADQRRLPGRGPGRLHRGAPLPIDAARRRRAPGCRSTSATTSARRPTSSTPAATSAAAAASSCCRAAPARPSSASRPWPCMQKIDAGPDHQHHRRQAVAARDPRQDRPDGGRGRRVHRRDQGDRPGDGGDLPDPDLPAGQDGGVPALQALRRARLGPDHLRRGAPAAGPGVPRDGPDPGPAPARADGHAGPRGRPRGGRLQPDRPEEVRRALARAGDAGLDRRGDLHRDPRRPAGADCGWSTPSPSWRDKYRIASENPAKDDVVAELLERYADERVLIIGQYLKQLRRLAQAVRHPAHHRRRRRNAEREDLYGKFRTRRGPAPGPVEGRQLRHRPAGRQRADPGVGHVRLAAGGGPAARAGSCGRRPTARRPTSTRW